MSKHTPGPWVAGALDDGDCCEVKCECGYFVATCHDGVRGERNAEANARLIAAGPELLEALVDCRRALEIANFTQELAIVDAAIAKATGETP